MLFLVSLGKGEEGGRERERAGEGEGEEQGCSFEGGSNGDFTRGHTYQPGGAGLE